MDKNVELFLSLWPGYEKRHIELTGRPLKDGKGKVTTAKTQTVPGPLSEELVAAHLNGDASIGVAPVRADSTCLWGVLDIDWYDMPEDEVTRVCNAVRTRCAAFRSKSRGLHVYVFVDEPISAKQMHDYLVALRKRLPKAIATKTEIFPKATQTFVTPDNEPTAVNLPIRHQARELAWLIDREGTKTAFDETRLDVLLQHIDEHCRMSAALLRDIADEQPTLDTSEIGYRVPDNPVGRNDLLMRVAMSMQARGWPDFDMDAEIRRLNGDAKFHHLFDQGPLPEGEVANLLKSAKKREKGRPTPLHYRQIEKFNREWAVMRVNGQVEFLNREEDVCYAKSAFLDATATRRAGKEPLAKLWLQDIDRAEYRGIVMESPDYDGPGWNIFRGWACKRESGDASLWEKYVQETLCGGDSALSHWVMTYIADAVQRPWSAHPGSALALRGGQGGGKSFLGRTMRKLLGTAHAQEFAQSDRLFTSFNRKMAGSTFVLCEESLFAGSGRQAAIAKAFITSDVWTYEQKYLASFDSKNVHRVIATTNEDQAVHIDHDDRRWTVIEVEARFDNHGPEARAWWEPYYRLVDDHPGIILDYLMQYEVDRGLIQYGHVTEAKASDKVASDPVLALMDEIAETGVCPDDIRGDGRISTATLARECYARGASRRDASRRFSNKVREKFGGESMTNCVNIEVVDRRNDPNGVLEVTPILRKDRTGVQMPPLPEFRRIVGRITGRQYSGKDEWGRFFVAGPGWDTDPNGGDPDAVEDVAKEFYKDGDGWKERRSEDIPF